MAVTFGGVTKAALDELSLLDETQLRRAIQTFAPQQSDENEDQIIDGTFTLCDLVNKDFEATRGAGLEPRPGPEPVFVRYSTGHSFSVNGSRERAPHLVRGVSSPSHIGANSYIYLAPAANECRDRGLLPGLETYKGVYLFNASSQRAQLTWQRSGNTFTEYLEPNDSVYIEPMTPFNLIGENEQLSLFLVAVPTRLSSASLVELSEFDRLDRVIEETTPWFKV